MSRADVSRARLRRYKGPNHQAAQVPGLAARVLRQLRLSRQPLVGRRVGGVFTEFSNNYASSTGGVQPADHQYAAHARGPVTLNSPGYESTVLDTDGKAKLFYFADFYGYAQSRALQWNTNPASNGNRRQTSRCAWAEHRAVSEARSSWAPRRRGRHAHVRAALRVRALAADHPRADPSQLGVLADMSFNVRAAADLVGGTATSSNWCVRQLRLRAAGSGVRATMPRAIGRPDGPGNDGAFNPD